MKLQCNMFKMCPCSLELRYPPPQVSEPKTARLSRPAKVGTHGSQIAHGVYFIHSWKVCGRFKTLVLKNLNEIISVF